jgi:hypothetical protein
MSNRTTKDSRKIVKAIAEGNFIEAERLVNLTLNSRIGTRINESRKQLAEKLYNR